MSNIDYVFVSSGRTLADVTAAVEAVVGGQWRGECLRPADQRAGVQVVEQRSGSGVVVLVYYAGDIEPRQALARSIYDALAASTDWTLELDSDDADDILASRTSSS